jgi:hypothetical protein
MADCGMKRVMEAPWTSRSSGLLVTIGSSSRNREAISGIQCLFLYYIAATALDYSRHPWRLRFAPPAAFAFAVLQTQSGLRRNDER